MFPYLWETGKTQPDIDTLHKIADMLEISIDELIYGNKRTNNVVHNHIHNTNVTENVGRGVGFGAVLAMIISYVRWQSIGWAILHGILIGDMLYTILLNMDGHNTVKVQNCWVNSKRKREVKGYFS